VQPDDLTWVGLAGEHVPALQGFTCADPPRASWDRLRRDHVHPRPEENALLAFSGDALAGVSRVSWTDGGEQLLVMSIARDVRFRRVGLGVVLLRQTLDVLRTVRDEAGAGCAAFARVDHRNEPSRRMFELAGFVYLENDFEEPNLEYWVHDLL
jgi:hypothetical protein